MNADKRILAVLEPDIVPREVIERATWLAEIEGAGLEILLCDPDVGPLSETLFVSNEAREIAERIREVQRQMLDDFAAPARERGVEVVTGILDRRPLADGIVDVALDRNPLYVVKGTRYHSDAERASLLDTDWHLIRTCPFPLWLVKPRPLAERPHIIAAVDPVHAADEPAELDDRIVERAKALAAASGGEVHLLHAFQPLAGIGAAAALAFKPTPLPAEEISERLEREHRRRLDALAAKHGIEAGRARQLPGSPLELLPWVAREDNADVVVMGVLARSVRSRDVVGSTAERVLDQLPCDVLIVRP
ncbi:MAG TPA: universal stress protein [Woeseiaceae bacterium]|nr:universal stress protein [Woeseiaceae bacterium]